jgi:hypothetical protein
MTMKKLLSWIAAQFVFFVIYRPLWQKLVVAALVVAAIAAVVLRCR